MTNEAAKNALTRYLKRDFDYTSGCGCNECMEIAEAMKCAIQALDTEIERKPTGGWIPVGERLPEEEINPVTRDYKYYLCVYHGKVFSATDVRCYQFGLGHWWHGPGRMDEYVTHWMPLPKRPESEG